MIAQSDKQRRPVILGFLILVVAVLFVLNQPHFLIETAPLWYRTAEPALLLIGLLGSVLRSSALRFVGWIGICCFLLVLIVATPDLDHVSSELSGAPTQWRVAVTLALWMSLAVCFRKLGVKFQPP
jgi:hypothetical protein